MTFATDNKERKINYLIKYKNFSPHIIFIIRAKKGSSLTQVRLVTPSLLIE